MANILDQSTPVILGNLLFTGYEIPGCITIGGSQRITIHKLPGGSRFIDAMGSDNSALSWQGIFVGPDAGQRARMLDLMRTDGVVRNLSFGDYIFNVVVCHVQYTFKERGSIISYQVRVEVVETSTQTNIIEQFSMENIISDCNIAVKLIKPIISANGNNRKYTQTDSSFIVNSYAVDLTNYYSTAISTLTLDQGDYNIGESPSYNNLSRAALETQAAITILSIDEPNQGLQFDNANTIQKAVYNSLLIASFVQANGYVNRAKINYEVMMGIMA